MTHKIVYLDRCIAVIKIVIQIQVLIITKLCFVTLVTTQTQKVNPYMYMKTEQTALIKKNEVQRKGKEKNLVICNFDVFIL